MKQANDRERFSVQPPLPAVAPALIGFTPEKLDRIDRFFHREIAAERVPGAVLAIARRGKLAYHKAFGYRDRVNAVPMTTDTVFALASMTKIMASVAALTLTEQGLLPLRAKLTDYFPSFADMQVGVLQVDGSLSFEPQQRPILIHDLLRHTSGLTYGGRSDHPVAKRYPTGDAPPIDGDIDQFIERLTKLPLMQQPGRAFEYGFSSDVLGAVIEKVTQKRLGDVLAQTLWQPLRMSDATFRVPAEKKSLLAQPFANNPLDGKPQQIRFLTHETKFDCGGAGAFATVGDYLRFGQMLVNGGVLDGKRILSPQVVAWMTSDHLGTDIQNFVAGIEPHREGYGFGLGVAVRTQPGIAAVPGNVGEFTWNGAYGTAFFADPQEELVVVLGTAAPGDLRKYYREQVHNLVYGAMSE